MSFKRIVPTLLIKDSVLVKTRQFKNPKYIGDPINAVKIFNTKQADELVLLDISAKGDINFDLIHEIVSEAFMPIAYGGRISNIEDIHKLFELGVDKIILNTVSFTNPKLVEEACSIYGSQSIVLSIDIKQGFLGKKNIYTQNGKKKIKAKD